MHLAVGFQALCIAMLFTCCMCNAEVTCDLRPLGTKIDPLPPDNRFQIEIKDIRENMYIPNTAYEVRLFSRDNVSIFIAFTLSLRPDTMYNKNNPRKPIILQTGTLKLLSNNTQYSQGCKNAIIQSDITPKTEIKAQWIAPHKDNKCVTMFALVAVQPDVWYNYEGPLSRQVCEDTRKADDMQPMENMNCQVCEDARYQLTFEGLWSPNTHPLMYPESQDLARFSDIVGASHSNYISVYKYNFYASEGLKMLAEQGNTTKLELEILDSLNNEVRHRHVRTLIKASAPPRPNLSTVAHFRVTRSHHLVSLTAAILPSPDWFLGVSSLELCEMNNKWAETVRLNLYPMDAGTDSGKNFESANDETSPPQPIKSAFIASGIKTEDMKPFARLLFQLVRTYNNPNCTEETDSTQRPETTGDVDTGDGNASSSEEEYPRPEYRPPPVPTSTTSEEPPSVDPETEESKCPMTTWSEWVECDGECIDNKVTGYQTRFRQHATEDPIPECNEKMATADFQRCEEECQEEQEEEDNEVEE